MRQTLFYIPPDLFGVPVFGFGIALFLLVVGMMLAAVRHYVRTKKLDDEIWNYLGLLVVGGAIILFVAPGVMEPGNGFPIRGYGVFLLIAILSALALVLRLAKPKGISSETVFSLCVWAVVSGIAGARLFYVTEYYPEMLAFESGSGKLLLGRTLFNIVNIPDGGLVVYGSILGGSLGSLIFMLRGKLPVLATFDAMAPAMMLGLAIGRIGCLMNGCCYGGPTDLCWGIVFPEGSPAHLHQIYYGDTFHYGMTFEEKTVEGNSRLVVKEVRHGSEAETSGVLPGAVLRGIGTMYDGKPLSWEVRDRRTSVELFNEFLHHVPETPVRFDFDADPESGSTPPETKSVFLRSDESTVRPVHPTQIYSSLTALTVCGLLLWFGRFDFFRSRDGAVFAAFMLLYAVARFCLEMIRTDEDSFMGTGLTVSQCVSVGVFLAGIALFAYILKQKSKPSTTS